LVALPLEGAFMPEGTLRSVMAGMVAEAVVRQK
jgi:hypothetical protein